MSSVELLQLSPEDGMEVYEMLQRLGPSENAFNNEVNGMTYEEYKDWLIERDAWSRGELLPDGYVKQWIYWLVAEGRPVGFGKLRERATEHSRLFGGNIGFAVDPLARGKGYGSKLFALLLEKAKEKGIHEVFSTVEKYNYRSKHVHEKCGGKLVKEDDVRWYFIFEL